MLQTQSQERLGVKMPIDVLPIGFLTSGAGGNPSGIGDYVKGLDAAGKPAVVFCNNGDVGISDAITIIKNGSTVPHQMLARVVRKGPINYDVPNYDLSPEAAAIDFYLRLIPEVHPTVTDNKDLIWIQLGNELDKNRADWLGWWSLESAKLWNDQGYRVAMVGWNSGEPEYEHWFTPGQTAYLNYCAQNREKAAVALHEYSFEVDDILREYPYLVGRFQFLFRACDEQGIARPDVYISEWGWERWAVPEPTKGTEDIIKVANLYSQFKQIRAASIWYLGPYQGSEIANKTQKLIAPVTDAAIAYVSQPFSLPLEVDPDGGAIAGDYKSVVYKIAQEHTKEQWGAITDEAYDDYKRTQTASTDNLLVMVADGNEESYGVIIDPSLPSQQEAISALEARGLSWVGRTMFTESNLIDVEIFGQCDPRWANSLTGTGPKTLCQWGCLLVDYTMLAQYWGISNRLPDDENDYYLANGGFSGQNVVSMAMSKVYPQVRNEGWMTWQAHGQAMVDKTIDYLSRGIPVPARLDFNPETDVWDQHWVLLVGWDGEDWWMNDPFTGKKTVRVSDYYDIAGQDILECIYYYLSTDIVDVASFQKADPTAFRVVKHSSGTNEDVQDMDLGGGLWVRRKNVNAEWWRMDSNFVYLVHDTSPSPGEEGIDRVYTLYEDQNKQVVGARKNPLKMSFDVPWSEINSHWVQFRRRDNCQDLSGNSGPATNSCIVIRHEKDGHTFNKYGQNLYVDEAIWLQTNNDEIQIYAKKDGKVVGWVGWESPWGNSEIVELYWDRGVMTKEPNRHCDF